MCVSLQLDTLGNLDVDHGVNLYRNFLECRFLDTSVMKEFGTCGVQPLVGCNMSLELFQPWTHL